MAERVLVVAFDGLDRELVEEYGLEHVPQQEFGAIDNHTGISTVKTAELFASFITGETHDVHGVVGLNPGEKGGEPVFDRVLHAVPQPVKDRLNTDRAQQLLSRLRPARSVYTRDDIQAPTLFDRLPRARAVNVPVYSQNTYLHRQYAGFELGYGKDVVRRDLEAEHSRRRQELFDAIDSDAPFVMGHFFYPDTFQHLYPGDDGRRSEMYRRMDALAADILDAASGFDTVIFMSDHGLPTRDAHNTNAFYSANTTLGLEAPHITDFHDLLIDRVQGDAAGVDV